MSGSIRFHFLFEQSGTFKRCALDLGYAAFDYDILNAFGETDFQIDLFKAIEDAYAGKPSLFDDMRPSDVVMAFFPCIRFCEKFQMVLSCHAWQLIRLPDVDKLERAMEAHDQLNRYYRLLSQLCHVCLSKGLRLVVENPHKSNYLLRYFPLSPMVVYANRRKFGDYYNKPTMFFFVGWVAYDNPILSCIDLPVKRVVEKERTVERSLISPQFARYFILSHLLPPEEVERCLGSM